MLQEPTENQNRVEAEQSAETWPAGRLQGFLLGGHTSVTLLKGLLWSHRNKIFSR